MIAASRTERHVGREQDLRQQFLNALQHGDVTAAEVLRRLDGLYVSRAHVRAVDPEVRRLRRLLWGAA